MSLFGRNLLNSRTITPLTFAIDAVVADLLAPKPVVVAQPAPAVEYPSKEFIADANADMLANPDKYTKSDLIGLAGRIGVHVASRWTKPKIIEAIKAHQPAQSVAA